MANTYFATDYNNTPPQIAEGCAPVIRPFNAVVNSGGTNVITLGSGDIIQLATLPANGFGIVICEWAMQLGILDTGSHALVLELGLILDSQDPGASSAASAGFFATGITPGASGGVISSFNQSLSSTIVIGSCPFTLGLAPNNNGGLYDLALQVTTPAGTVSAVNALITGYIKYFTVSQPWSR